MGYFTLSLAAKYRWIQIESEDSTAQYAKKEETVTYSKILTAALWTVWGIQNTQLWGLQRVGRPWGSVEPCSWGHFCWPTSLTTTAPWTLNTQVKVSAENICCEQPWVFLPRKAESQLNCLLDFEWEGYCRQMLLWNVKVASTQPRDVAWWENTPDLRLHAIDDGLVIAKHAETERLSNPDTLAHLLYNSLLKIWTQKGKGAWGKWVKMILTLTALLKWFIFYTEKCNL